MTRSISLRAAPYNSVSVSAAFSVPCPHISRPIPQRLLFREDLVLDNSVLRASWPQRRAHGRGGGILPVSGRCSPSSRISAADSPRALGTSRLAPLGAPAASPLASLARPLGTTSVPGSPLVRPRRSL